MKKDPIGRSLLFAYILSLFASHLIFPPFFSHRFQPSEAVFLITVIFYHKLFLNRAAYVQFAKKAWPILLYLGVIVLMSIMQPSEYAFYKSVGTLYLVLVAFLFFHKGQFLWQSKTSWLNVMAVLSLCTALPIFIGYVMRWFGVEAPLDLFKSFSTYYPLVGYYGRPEGFHISPTLLFVSLVLPFWTFIIALLHLWKTRTWQLLALGFACIVFLLTLDKDLFTIGALLILLFATIYSSMPKWLGIIGACLLLLTQQFLVHFIPVDPATVATSTYIQGFERCFDQALFHISGIPFYETHYALLRIFEWSILSDIGFWGIGLGEFPEALRQFQPLSPRYEDCYAPLSLEPNNTYVGLGIEAGVLGLVAALLLFVNPIVRIFKKYRRHPQSFTLLLLLILITFAWMGVSTDVEDFRPLWVVLGLSFGLVGKKGVKCKV